MMLGLGLVLAAGLAWWLWTPDRDRGWLERKYLAARGDMRDVAGWRLHVRDSGPRDAPALVLIHGFGSSLQTWDGWASALGRHRRVVCFDLPGSGLSPPDPAGDYSDTRSLLLLRALLDSLGLQRVSLVGHSLGGRIAWKFAAAHPQAVERLVLVAPDGFASPGFAYDQPPQVPAVLGLMRHVMPRPVLRMNLAPAYADPQQLGGPLLERYDDLLRAPGARQAMLDRMRQTVLVDPRPLLATLRMPILLLWGAQDAMIPSATSADFLAALDGAQRVVIERAGHLPQEEAAGESLAALESFLAG